MVEGLGADGFGEIANGGRTGEGDPIGVLGEDFAGTLCQAFGRDGSVGFHNFHLGPALAEGIGQDIAGDGGPRDQDSLAFHVMGCKSFEQSLRYILLRGDVHLEVEPFEGVARGRTDGTNEPPNAAEVPGALVEAFEKTFDAIDGGKDEEVVGLQPQECGIESFGVARLDFNDREFDDAGTEFGELGGECGRLLTGSGDDDLLAEEGKLFEPAETLAQLHNFADDDGGGGLHPLLVNQGGKRGEGSDEDFLIGPGTPADGHGRGVGVAAFFDDSGGDLSEMGQAHEDDEGLSSAHFGPVNAVHIMPGYKGDDGGVVSMGERDSGIGCDTQG